MVKIAEGLLLEALLIVIERIFLIQQISYKRNFIMIFKSSSFPKQVQALSTNSN